MLTRLRNMDYKQYQSQSLSIFPNITGWDMASQITPNHNFTRLGAIASKRKLSV
jgi:hypothetical protein